jgi:hypothetical protein
MPELGSYAEGPHGTSEWWRHYDEQMRYATDLYSDVVEALHQLELDARVDQTGGMCLAVIWEVRNGYYMLTDLEEPLPWDRERDHQGWTLGFYQDDESGSTEDYVVTDDPSVEAAVRLVYETLLGKQTKP